MIFVGWGVDMSRSAAKACAVRVGAILVAVLLLAIVVTALMPSPAVAQSWPTTWILIDTDPNEPGQANYRDVLSAYYNYDSSHLYLRLSTVSVPSFSGANGQARFKWFIDVGLGSNLHFSGGNILGTDYLLFVEDTDNNGSGEVYLLPANGNDSFSQYEPWNNTNRLPIGSPTASYRIIGNSIDVWIAFSQLGVASPDHMSLAWATDQEDPGLESAPNLDSTDGTETPIHLDADLFVDKDVSNHTPSEGNSVTYTVTVTNSGPATATNVQITDLVPGGVTYQSYTATQGSYSSVSGLWTVGTLANGASATLTITVTVNAGTAGSTITNTATITAAGQPDPDPGDNSDSASIYVNGLPPNLADISVLKEASNPFPYVGDTITFTVTVQNSGPAAATNILVSDALPAGVIYQSHAASLGTYNNGSDVWSIPSLGDGASATLTVTSQVTSTGTLANTASITADQTDPDLGDNSDTVELFATNAPVFPPPSGSPRGVPVFPNIYVGISAALGAGVLAYLVRRRMVE